MLHIIQNDRQVPPGNISQQLEAKGELFLVHHPYLGAPLPDLRDTAALIVMGGAMGANDDLRHPFLYDLKIFIREVVKSGIPYLGVCLGGQLLAAALGAKVVSNRWEELGTLEIALNTEGQQDRLFNDIDNNFATFQWHHDSFDLPEEAVLLASSPACPNQAFRLAEKAWGLQFHPEVTETIIRDWCAWDPATKSRTEELVSAWQACKEDYFRVSAQLLENFLTVAKDT